MFRLFTVLQNEDGRIFKIYNKIVSNRYISWEYNSVELVLTKYVISLPSSLYYIAIYEEKKLPSEM